MLHQKEFSKVFSNFYNLFINDLNDAFNSVKSTIENISSAIREFTSSTPSEILLNKKEKHFLILYTANYELFILDAVTGEKKFDKQFPNYIVNHIKPPNEKQDNSNFYLNIELKPDSSILNNEDLLIIQINLLNFSYQEIEFGKKSKFSFEVLSDKINNFLLSNSDTEKVKLNLPIDQSTFIEQKSFENKIIVNYNTKLNSLFGLIISGNSTDSINKNLKPIWNLNLHNHTLVDYKISTIPENIFMTYNSMGKILYKHIDYNIAVILTNPENSSTLNFSVINLLNGKILFQTQILNVDIKEKINIIFDENFIIINYVKKTKNLLRNEIYIVEILKREIEHSLKSLLEKYFNINTILGNLGLIDDEDHHLIMEKEKKIEDQKIHSDDLVFMSKTFLLNRKPKKLFFTNSKLNLANKYLIFLMESNQIYFVDKRALSPRRPVGKVDPKNPLSIPVVDPLMNSPYADLEIMVYMPNVIFDSKFILDVGFSGSQIDGITVHPTQYESTFILCTSGLNVNCYKVYPDKPFDYFVSVIPNVFILFGLIGIFVKIILFIF